MTDFTIRKIRDLRELSDPPGPRPKPDPDEERAARDARFAEIQALIATLDRKRWVGLPRFRRSAVPAVTLRRCLARKTGPGPSSVPGILLPPRITVLVALAGFRANRRISSESARSERDRGLWEKRCSAYEEIIGDILRPASAEGEDP
jgi:hypothetical protein